MNDFIKRFDALPAEVQNEIYIHIGQAAEKLPPVSNTKAYLAAVKEIAEKYMQEQ